MVRRPLFLTSVLILLLFLGFQSRDNGKTAILPEEGAEILVEGNVENAECWQENGVSRQLLYLKEVTFPEAGYRQDKEQEISDRGFLEEKAFKAGASWLADSENSRKETGQKSEEKTKSLLYLKTDFQSDIYSYFHSISDLHSGFFDPQAKQQKKETENIGILCYLEEGENLPEIGSRVQIRGKAGTFEEATNEGQFSMAEYYRQKGYLFPLWKGRIVRKSEAYNRIGERLFWLKQAAGKNLEIRLGEKDASVIKAMLLGIKKGLDEDRKELFQLTGIAHILAISGLHISLLGMGLYRLLARLGIPGPVRCAGSFLLLIIYGCMVGFGVSTLRAILMFSLFLSAQVLGRTYDMPTAIAGAALALLFSDPCVISDSSFQLSFSAVLSASLVAPRFASFQKAGTRMDKRKPLVIIKEKILNSLFFGMAVSTGMLPVMLACFYQWNAASFLANLAVVPLMGILLPAGILAALPGAGLIAMRPVCLLIHIILFFYDKICQLCMKIPGSMWHTGTPQLWQILLFFSGLAGLCVFAEKCRRLPAFFLCLLLCAAFLVRIPDGMLVTMIDVGQGESIYLETAKGSSYLIDAGSTSVNQAGTYRIIPYLRYRGVKELGAIFVTHWDTDHQNALEELFAWAGEEQVKIKKLVLPDVSLKDEMLLEVEFLAKSYGIPIVRMKEGDILSDDGMKLTCLHPFQGENIQERNAASLVFLLEYENFTALFTGDLEAEGENYLLEENLENLESITFLKAGHHGSDTSCTEEFIHRLNPRVTFISCGRENSYGHPSEEVIRRLKEQGSKVFVTAREGMLTLKVKKGKITVDTYLAGT